MGDLAELLATTVAAKAALPIIQQETLDWYDGEIVALLDLGPEHGKHVALLLAWDPEVELRAYALLPASSAWAETFREGLGVLLRHTSDRTGATTPGTLACSLLADQYAFRTHDGSLAYEAPVAASGRFRVV